MSEIEPRAAVPVARAGWYPQPDGRTLWWDGYAWHPEAQQVATYRPVGPSSAVVAVSWLIAVFTLLYMLPWAVATTRGKLNHGPIAVVNLLAGWTIIGWVAALVMACL